MLGDRLVEALEALGDAQIAARAKAVIDGGERSIRATVVLGTARSASLPGGERIEVCAADHILHVRCERLAGERLLAVRAQDCDLSPAPAGVEAGLML